MLLVSSTDNLRSWSGFPTSSIARAKYIASTIASVNNVGASMVSPEKSEKTIKFPRVSGCFSSETAVPRDARVIVSSNTHVADISIVMIKSRA